MLLKTLIDSDRDLEIPHRVGVDRQKLDFLHRPRELAGDRHGPPFAKSAHILQQRDEVIALREEIRCLAELVYGQRENAECGDDH